MRRMEMKDDITPIDKKCIEKGISRTDLSRMSGVPIRTLEGWAKRARTNPNVYQLLNVAQVLECHIEDLLEPESARQAAGEPTEQDK